MTVQALTCQEVVEIVTDYLEGSLSRRDRKRFEEHLADCPHCREYLREMRITIATAGSIGETDIDAMPSDLRNRLLEAFRDADA